MATRVKQWEDSDWGDTVKVVGVGNRLYSIERDGTLYATHAVTGSSKAIGEGYQTRLLLASGYEDGDLYAIERNGNLYKIDRESGEWKALSEDGDWADTIAADVNGNMLYSIERDGTLYATDLDNFDEDSIELDTGYDTRAMWASGDYIYVLEKDGTLYKVDAESGEYERFGEAGAYSDTVAATIHDGHFYAIEDDGAVGVTSLEDGSYTEHTDEDLGDVKHLFSTPRRLYAIHQDGTLSTLAFD